MLRIVAGGAAPPRTIFYEFLIGLGTLIEDSYRIVWSLFNPLRILIYESHDLFYVAVADHWQLKKAAKPIYHKANLGFLS